MQRDKRNYYQRKADSTNLDSKPGARNANRRLDDGNRSPDLPGLENGRGSGTVADFQAELQAGIRYVQNLYSLGRFGSGGDSPYVDLPIVHRRFICPICGQDIRYVPFCNPSHASRFNFDPDTVVDANPNRPELE